MSDIQPPTTEKKPHGGPFVMLGVLFVALKLCGAIDWSWWWVTAPFWGGLAVALVMMVVTLISVVLILLVLLLAGA